MLTLYYGNGNGKTGCAIGTAVRAAAKDKKVLFVEFIRQNDLSDRKALETMYSVTVSSAPVDLDLCDDELSDSKAQVAKVFRELFDTAVITVLTKQYDMLILDGVFDALEKGFLLETEVYDFLSNSPDSLDVICTGVSVDEKFISLSNYATKLNESKADE